MPSKFKSPFPQQGDGIGLTKPEPDAQNKTAKKIVNAILADVTDRRGWRQEWDGFDEDVKREIRKAWRETIVNIILDVPKTVLYG